MPEKNLYMHVWKYRLKYSVGLFLALVMAVTSMVYLYCMHSASLAISHAVPIHYEHTDIPPTSVGYKPESNISDRDPQLQIFYHQKLQWIPCLTDKSRVTECSWLVVPIDYSNPKGETGRLLVSRVHAVSSHPVANVIMNPGGPGESGVEASFMFSDIWRKNLGQNLNLVSFDPRATGHSRPSGSCLSDAEQDRQRAMPDFPNDPAGISKLEQLNVEFAQGCVKHFGKTFLQHVGTADVAKDMDVLRAALGDERLTYLGFSYGTLLGTVYAEQFPNKVRAMVLDAVVNQQTDQVHEVIASAGGREKTLEDFARDCIRNHPFECPLGFDSSKQGIINAFHRLTWPYRFKSAHTTSGRPAYIGDIFTGINAATYRSGDWPGLRQGLMELSHGNADILQKFADIYMQRDKDGHYGSLNDTLRMVHCADAPPISQQSIDYIDGRIRQVAPILDDGLGNGKSALMECSYWPVPYTLRAHPLHITQKVPFVVVSTIHDPATPYQAGVDLAHAIGGRLITVQDSQHTAVMQNPCVDAIVKRYLASVVIPANTVCPAA